MRAALSSAPQVMVSGATLAGGRVVRAILATATPRFLGLGAQPPTPEWGARLNSGREYVGYAPWTMILPGLSLFLAVMAVNLIGDRLTQALDPSLARRG